MVTITNGKTTMGVTRGAYNSIYKSQGYREVEARKVDNGLGGAAGVTDDDAFVASMRIKPIAQWNKADTKRFAALVGVDISGTANANEAKERIRVWLDAEDNKGDGDE